MASTYSSHLRLELMATGDQSGTWGDTTNTNLGTLLDQAIAGRSAVTMTDAEYTLVANNGASDEARQMILNIAGALTGTQNVICPTVSKLYVIKNATSGSQSIVLKTAAGTGITIPTGKTMLLFCDGTNVVNAIDYFTSLTVGAFAATTATVGGATVTAFPAGTLMLFQQTSAPTGWTKQGTHNDKALRVVSGTASSGGATAFTTVFGSGKTTGSYTLATADIPAHSHTASSSVTDPGHTHSNVWGFGGGGGSKPSGGTSGSTGADNVGTNTTGITVSTTTSNTGGGGGHTHTLSLDLQYVDLIIAAKD